MSRKNIKWLNEQLPMLVSDGVITPDTAAKLKSHYESQLAGSTRSVALTIFGVLGGLLIAAGIMLLVGHNWPQFGRATRAALSIALVMVGQLVVAVGLLRGRTGAAFREGAGIFAQITFGAGFALIAQTYHLSDDLNAFVLTWMLCSLPLVYILDAVGPALVYLFGVTWWAFQHNSWMQGENPVAWWGLMLLIATFAVQRMRKAPYKVGTIFLMWGMAIALGCGTGVCLGSGWNNLWIVIYAGLYVSLYLAGSFWQGEGTSLWQRPLTLIGGGGSAILAYVLTFEHSWDRIGWQEYTAYNGARMPPWTSWHDIGLACAVTVIAVLLMVTCRRRAQSFRLTLGILPVFAALGYLVTSLDTKHVAGFIFCVLANIYFFVYGILAIVEGLRERRLGMVNYGMLLVGLLILTRFFDTDIGFIIKGVVFIFLGCCFLGVNVFLARKRKGGAA